MIEVDERLVDGHHRRRLADVRVQAGVRSQIGVPLGVRVVGIRNESLYFIQVNRGESIPVKVGEAVEGTPFTFNGIKAPGMPEGDPDVRPIEGPVYFTDTNGVVHYGSIGAGETDGVSF